MEIVSAREPSRPSARKFFDRNEEAARRQRAFRSQIPTVRGFDGYEVPFVKTSPGQTPRPPKSDTAPPALPEFDDWRPPLITAESLELATARAQRVIQAIVGPAAVMGDLRLGILLRRFMISDPELQALFRKEVAVDDGEYATVRICSVLFAAAVGTNPQGLAGRIRPFVHATMANMRGTVASPRGAIGGGDRRMAVS
jgi:hypothetical protein